MLKIYICSVGSMSLIMLPEGCHGRMGRGFGALEYGLDKGTQEGTRAVAINYVTSSVTRSSVWCCYRKEPLFYSYVWLVDELDSVRVFIRSDGYIVLLQ